eukprot:GHVQ01007118.1.p1 GENE.GHVQ01007118.1~~GHVQ01007118.1.p1  ORF type:complete len:457 (-),score=51.66 GHVQ01007118.1:895-2265(-)
MIRALRIYGGGVSVCCVGLYVGIILLYMCSCVCVVAWVGSSTRSVHSITGRVHRVFDEDSHQFVLTDHDDFQQKVLQDVEGESFWFVAFTVPWCPHCEALKPEFEKASKLRTLYPIADEPRVQFVSVDCTTNKQLCLSEAHKVDLLPTLRLYHKGHSVNDYTQVNRKAQDFLEYLKRMTKPPVVELQTASQLREVLQREQISFIMMISSDQPVPPIFEEVAQLYFDKHIFGVVRVNELRSGLEIEDVDLPYIIDVGPDVTLDPYSGPWEDVTPLLEWVKTHRFHVVEEVSRLNFDGLRKSDRTLIVVVVNPYASDFQRTVDKLYQVAVSWRSRNRFLFGYWNGDEYARLLQNFDVYKSELPRVIGFQLHIEGSDIQVIYTYILFTMCIHECILYVEQPDSRCMCTQYYYEDRNMLTLDNLSQALGQGSLSICGCLCGASMHYTRACLYVSVYLCMR